MVELLVSMVIFAVLLAIFTSGIASMSRTTARVTSTGEASTELSRLYNRLDREIPYATAVNRPVQVGGSWYLEFATRTTKAGTAPYCTQYRYVPSTGTVDRRRWNESGPPGVTAWARVSTGVQARGGASPWTFQAAGSTYERQRLVVAVDVVRPRTPVQQLDTTFVARNTDANTLTNVDANADGISDTQVCTSQGVGRT